MIETNKSQVEKILDELHNSTMTFENYKKYIDKVEMANQIILTQVENMTREYKSYGEKLNEIRKDASFEDSLKRGFISKDSYDTMRMMINQILGLFSWRTLHSEILDIVFKKMSELMKDVNALEIKRDAMKLMGEMETNRNKMFMDAFKHQNETFETYIKSKLSLYEERVMKSFKDLAEKNTQAMLLMTKNLSSLTIPVQDSNQIPSKNNSFKLDSKFDVFFNRYDLYDWENDIVHFRPIEDTIIDGKIITDEIIKSMKPRDKILFDSLNMNSRLLSRDKKYSMMSDKYEELIEKYEEQKEIYISKIGQESSTGLKPISDNIENLEYKDVEDDLQPIDDIDEKIRKRGRPRK